MANSIKFNFSFFFHAAIKGNTARNQKDSVYILLLGCSRKQYEARHPGIPEELSDSVCTNYVKGGSPIKSVILSDILDCSWDEITRRLVMLRFQNVRLVAEQTKRVLGKFGFLSDILYSKSPDSEDSAYMFLTAAYRTALCSPDRHLLSKKEIDDILRAREHSAWQDPSIQVGREKICIPSKSRLPLRDMSSFFVKTQKIHPIYFQDVFHFLDQYNDKTSRINKTFVSYILSDISLADEELCYMEFSGTPDLILNTLKSYLFLGQCSAAIYILEIGSGVDRLLQQRVAFTIYECVSKNAWVDSCVQILPEKPLTYFRLRFVYRISKSIFPFN